MDKIITSIKIDKPIKDAAKIRATELDMTFGDYFVDLILKDLKENKPELFKEYIDGNIVRHAKEKTNAICQIPFGILGISDDDGKAYFLDRHERLYSMRLDTLSKQKLLCLAPLTWWKDQYCVDGKISWDNAYDEIIELSGKITYQKKADK